MIRNAFFVAALAALPAIAAAQGGNPTLGRDLAAGCTHCHGTNGVSAGVTESLAGRPQGQIVSTLKHFREGTKPATIMHQISKGYTDEQIAAIAAFFAAQPPAGK
ncbi:MAG: c-type cytochrome [Burkholderiales bacterium]|nr:c-type cytochrome [Burkholderiales bacterium]